MTPARLVAALGLTVVAVLPSAPAYAAPDRLELSPDGSTWSTTLERPLFQDAPALVPLGSISGTFYVRNASEVPARASVELSPPPRPDGLAEHLTVSTRIGTVRAAQPARPPRADGCGITVTGSTMRPGAWQRVDVVLQLADLEGRTAQGATTRLSLVVRLTQVRPRGVVTVCGVQAEADRGVPEPAVGPCAAVALVGLGSAAPCAGATAAASPGGGGTEGRAGAVDGTREEPRRSEAATSTAHGASAVPPPGDGAVASSRPPRGVPDVALTAAALLGFGAALLVVRRRRTSASARPGPGVSGTRVPARSTTPGGR